MSRHGAWQHNLGLTLPHLSHTSLCRSSLRRPSIFARRSSLIARRSSLVARRSALARSTPCTPRLHLFGADLTGGAEAFKEAAKGCSSMIHLASVVNAANIKKKFATTEERNKFQVEASVAGTTAALEAAKYAGMRKVVVTSSVASISPTKAKQGPSLGDPACQPYDESDLNDVATMNSGVRCRCCRVCKVVDRA